MAGLGRFRGERVNTMKDCVLDSVPVDPISNLHYSIFPDFNVNYAHVIEEIHVLLAYIHCRLAPVVRKPINLIQD